MLTKWLHLELNFQKFSTAQGGTSPLRHPPAARWRAPHWYFTSRSLKVGPPPSRPLDPRLYEVEALHPTREKGLFIRYENKLFIKYRSIYYTVLFSETPCTISEQDNDWGLFLTACKSSLAFLVLHKITFCMQPPVLLYGGNFLKMTDWTLSLIAASINFETTQPW